MAEHPDGLVPVPARISIALNAPAAGRRRLEGPDVDVACGAVEPAVDMWEAGLEVPTRDQVERLARLTGYPIGWFYKPFEPGQLVAGGIVCYSRGPRGKRCQDLPATWVDDRQVLHHEGEPPQQQQTFQGALF